MRRVLPILFNAEMVRGILDQRKTATRRVARKIPVETHWIEVNILSDESTDIERKEYECHWGGYQPDTGSFVDGKCIVKPPCQPGDILYVRETYRPLSDHPKAWVEYAADWSPRYFENSKRPNCCNHGKWMPSIHMPKKYARIWLKIKDVKAERLHNMTLDDFLSEGIIVRPEAFNDPENAYQQAKNIFKEIWNATIKRSELELYGWNANPWTWVIEFEQCDNPEPCIKEDI